MHRDAFIKAIAHTRQCLIDEGDAARVVVGRDAVLGNIDRLSDGGVRPADRVGQRLWIELVARGRQLCVLGRRDETFFIDQKTRVGLDADKVCMRARDANPIAIALPMPLLQPVTSAVLPERLKKSFFIQGH